MIPIKKGITGTDIPNIAVETSDSTIPRKPILVEGGPAPEPITVTPLTVTENGTYNAGENAAYNPVTVNVPPFEPSTKIVSEFDFSQAEYDIIRSIVADNVLLKVNRDYNTTYDDVNGLVSWTNGYGNVQPAYYIEPFKNYEMIFDFGNCQTTASDNREVFGIRALGGGSSIVLYWEGKNNRFRIANSSGKITLDDYNDLSIINNSKPIIKIQWSTNKVVNVCRAYFKFNRLDETEEFKFMGDIDYRFGQVLNIGRFTNNAIAPAELKYIKITENKWTPKS